MIGHENHDQHGYIEKIAQQMCLTNNIQRDNPLLPITPDLENLD